MEASFFFKGRIGSTGRRWDVSSRWAICLSLRLFLSLIFSKHLFHMKSPARQPSGLRVSLSPGSLALTSLISCPHPCPQTPQTFKVLSSRFLHEASSGCPSTGEQAFCSDHIMLSFRGLSVFARLHGTVPLNGDRWLTIELFPGIQAGHPQHNRAHLEGWESAFNPVSPSTLSPGSQGQQGNVTETKWPLIHAS